MATENVQDDCLFSQIGVGLQKEIAELTAQSVILGQRMNYLLTGDAQFRKDFLKVIATEFVNSKMGQALIMKAESYAVTSLTNLAVGAMAPYMNDKYAGKTLSEWFSLARPMGQGIISLIQLLCSLPIFMIGIIKMALETTAISLNKEEERISTIVSNCENLAMSIKVNPFGSEIFAQQLMKIKLCRDLLVQADAPLIRTNIALEYNQGVIKGDLETVRSNILAAKSVLIQDFDQALNDPRIKAQPGMWSAIKYAQGELNKDTWGDLDESMLNEANRWLDKEEVIWKSYKELVMAHLDTRACLAGMDSTARIILGYRYQDAQGNFGVDSEYLRNLLTTKLLAMQAEMEKTIEEMSYYINTEDSAGIAKLYWSWVGSLATLTYQAVNPMFDLASGWTAVTDELKRDYEKLEELTNTISGDASNLLTDDPAIDFFRQVTSFHNNFIRASEGKVDIQTTTVALKQAADKYKKWIGKARWLTTLKFEAYGEIAGMLDLLKKLGYAKIAENLSKGITSDILGSGGWVTNVAEVFLNCIIKKQKAMANDSKATASDKKMLDDLASKYRALTALAKSKTNSQAAELNKRQEEIKKTIDGVKSQLEGLRRLVLLGIAVGQRAGEEGFNPYDTVALTQAVLTV